MGKINVLTPNVFNMIAAGEVVERPASVVKELVENSIDAGATEISVDVEEGGIRRITVSDNGTGIDRDDIRAAFLPHATSKLEDISDLDTISTLGFRGEALASIASVSEVTLESRSRGSDMARKITLVAGKVVSEEDSGRWEGTAITVENLFFNTPARLKFLKKASAELGYIVDKIEKIVLANPSLKVRLTSERGVEIEHNGGSLEDAISSVYPEVDMTRLIPVDRTSSGNLRVSGYVSDVEYTAPTRAKQTVIVNGRVVENDTVAAAIEKAYRDFLVKRTYPVFVLDIIVPFDEVEVNVHPTKAEVRFRNKSAVFGAVFRAVDEAVRSAFVGSVHGFDVAADAAEKPENRFEQTKIDTSALYYDAPPAPVAPPADSRHAARDYSTPFELGSLRNTGSYGSKKAAESAVGITAGHIVNNSRPELLYGHSRHIGTERVDRNNCVRLRPAHRFQGRTHAFHLLVGRNIGRTGARRIGTDVDNRTAFGHYLVGAPTYFQLCLAAASGVKRIGRGVKNAHHLRLRQVRQPSVHIYRIWDKSFHNITFQVNVKAKVRINIDNRAILTFFYFSS